MKTWQIDLMAVGAALLAVLLTVGMIKLDSTCAENVTRHRGFVCDVAHGYVAILAPQRYADR